MDPQGRGWGRLWGLRPRPGMTSQRLWKAGRSEAGGGQEASVGAQEMGREPWRMRQRPGWAKAQDSGGLAQCTAQIQVHPGERGWGGKLVAGQGWCQCHPFAVSSSGPHSGHLLSSLLAAHLSRQAWCWVLFKHQHFWMTLSEAPESLEFIIHVPFTPEPADLLLDLSVPFENHFSNGNDHRCYPEGRCRDSTRMQLPLTLSAEPVF